MKLIEMGGNYICLNVSQIESCLLFILNAFSARLVWTRQIRSGGGSYHK